MVHDGASTAVPSVLKGTTVHFLNLVKGFNLVTRSFELRLDVQGMTSLEGCAVQDSMLLNSPPVYRYPLK
jgi:hypothetical protein